MERCAALLTADMAEGREREKEKKEEEQSEEWKLLCGSRAEEKAHCDWQMTQEQRDT